ncbi:saccharopine dehydrogenase NADP-binding domain-containing protein [Nocardioides sp. YIM 152315]|uniref:saccharopine dehydrogenase family protein n=1 Tax=Nocardioides sp. YIM 152315 TaxID=3031760 RepID=UPI0023DAF8D2|nr:saccharopine dehydrogenase NADP-binding domain-containing protein [Nocardioides sp. YIM 152315]MDF1605939.1 saccharopine dehydrogenase NADP-binding domain-containing protein [Nocardioides sp. YIM 152315]
MAAARELDLVLFGATGFTGGLTADYLARHAPRGLRWALAGRNQQRLEAVRRRLAEVDPALADLPLLHADVDDPASLADVAARAGVVITTVGPYVAYGEPLVAACAEAGTDYVDLTGEPEFVDRTYLRHHETAVRSGARIVHACGFDSVPHDLGLLYAVQQLRATGPVTARGVVRAQAMFSGGTFHSAMTAFARARQLKALAQERRRVEPRPEGRRSRAVAGRPRRDPLLGYWLLPLPTIDPTVVARSGAALAAYGPDFRYSHYAGTRTLRYAAGGAAGVGAMVLAAQVPPLRRLALDRIKPGEGPDEARRARSWFTVDVVAEGDGRAVHTRVSGGDPGYDETAKMLAESALCLALDDNPSTAGQVTTAQAMGDALLGRLQAAGIRFEVVE